MNSTRRPKHIVIINQVSLNLGDAAILWGMMAVLRDRYGTDAVITVFDSAADSAQQERPWAHFRTPFFVGGQPGPVHRIIKRIGYGHRYEMVKKHCLTFAMNLIVRRLGALARLVMQRSTYDSLRCYANADLIVSAGGTYLIENYNLLPRVHEFEIAMAAHKPLILFTQTLGPFSKEPYRRSFQRIFNSANLILLRDPPSLANVRNLGCETPAEIVPDAAFVLASEASKLSANGSPRLRMAVSVRALDYFSVLKQTAYREAIAAAVVWAVRQCQAEVVFLSTCQGVDAYWTDDSKEAEIIRSTLPEDVLDRVSVDNRSRQPVEFVRDIGAFDAVLATRMHAAILALCAGVPTAGIAYEFKMTELMKSLSLEHLCTTVDNITPDATRDITEELLSNREALRTRIAPQIDGFAKAAWKVSELLPTL